MYGVGSPHARNAGAQGAPRRPAIATVREYSIRPQRKLLRSSFVKVFSIVTRLFFINLLCVLVYRIKIPPHELFVKENFLYFGKPHTRRNEPHDYGTGKAEIGNSDPFMVIFVQLSKRYCGERQSVVFLHQ